MFFCVLGLWTESQAAQDATVATDGAIVYSSANFDSRVLGYFRSGQKIRISDKTIGPFYRVIFQKRIGYISDIDVKVQGANPSSPLNRSLSSNNGQEKENTQEDQKKPPKKGERPSVDKSLASRSRAGIMASYVFNQNYIKNRKEISFEDSNSITGGFLTYGLKFNFSSQMFLKRQIWDVTTHFTLTAPNGYQNNIAVFVEPQLLIFLDALMKNNGFLFIGLGPTVNYLRLSKEDGSQPLSKIGFGAIVSFHFGIHFNSLILNIEPRYYIGLSNAPAVLFSVQKTL